MKKNLLLYAALVIALAPGCAKKPAESGSGPKAGRGPVPVRTALVERRDISEVLLFTGELESPLAVEVKPKIQGRLEKLELEGGEPTTEGAEVKAKRGDCRTGRRELEAQVALAEAQARQAEVTLADREAGERRRLEALLRRKWRRSRRATAVTAHESARAAGPGGRSSNLRRLIWTNAHPRADDWRGDGAPGRSGGDGRAVGGHRADCADESASADAGDSGAAAADAGGG